jgi:hypothetical protein
MLTVTGLMLWGMAIVAIAFESLPAAALLFLTAAWLLS